MNRTKHIYIVLTGTGTAFSNMIKWFTKAELNHASLAFDEQLTEVYSFGRKHIHNPFRAGLIRENFADPFYRETECAIYRLPVSSREYDMMYAHVQGMMRNQECYKYHLLGLIGVLLNTEIHRKNAYFCSHFVASVIERSGQRPVEKPACFVTPEDFASSLRPYGIYRGSLSLYIRFHRQDALVPAVQAKASVPANVVSGAVTAMVGRIRRLVRMEHAG